ncbi:transient receptor potential cation channel subfamily M member 5-like [Amphiura filiformis]|uniref:transient receptor potential cation channel subfamily M member 5-like n=1 Tax=Amphiura filiformis TaxID=82378 RepID=UPI003B226334
MTLPPGLVLSVTGGAWDFPRNAVVKEVFRKGLVDAAVKNGDLTMIITGGTHKGVMKYTARGLSEYEWAHKPTVSDDIVDLIILGVTTWGSLQQELRDKLEEAVTNHQLIELEVQKLANMTNNSTKKVLEPNHSHFIFVDDTTGQRTAANELRVKLERELRTFGETQYLTCDDKVNRCEQISCSSSSHRTCQHTQIGLDDSEAWIADVADSNQWISIDLTYPRRVTGLVIKGNPQADLWVTKFKVMYSDDEEDWKVVDNRKFDGTSDRDTNVATCRFSSTVRARFFKIQPTEWHGDRPSMRFDLLVCKDVAVVCVLVEGGMYSIRQACSSVEAGTPLVVVADSGRGANVLAHAFKEDQDENIIKAELNEIIRRDEDVDSTLELIKEAAKKPNLLNIYDGSCEGGIQASILEALQRDDEKSMDVDIKLAFQWGYHEVLKEQMFASSFTYNWKMYNVDELVLEDLLRETILKNQVEFVKLLIDNDVVNLDKCITWSMIKQLYSKATYDVKPLPGHMSRIKASQEESVLDIVQEVMQDLAFDKFSYYQKDNRGHDNDPVEDPYRHLFIFALLWGYDEMALYFWEEDTEPIASALAASNMYKNQSSNISSRYKEQQEHLKEMEEKFAELAYESLNACEATSKTADAFNMVLRNVPSWGDTTCLKLAELSHNLTFIGHAGIQTLVEEIWQHGLHKPGPNASLYIKAKNLVQSPRVAFYHYLMFYLSFLALLSYMMLSDQLANRWPQGVECVLMFWVATFIVEEIREVIAHSPKRYIRVPWNWIDIFNLTLFTVGMILRLTAYSRNEARVILAFSLFGFYFRLLHKLTPFKCTGPKVLMVGQMIIDVLVILIIMIILLLGYGVSTTAIMYPHTSDPVSLLTSIIYRPYFQIYGEIFHDYMYVTADDGGCTTNETAIQLDGAVRCPEHVGWGLFCLALWMILSNALLLNLLIAMFTNTYERVNEKNELLWRFMWYTITKEYYKKPSLAPPFIIIVHVWRLGRFIFKNVWEWNSPTLKLGFNEDEQRHIKALEKQVVYDYIMKKRRDVQEQIR